LTSPPRHHRFRPSARRTPPHDLSGRSPCPRGHASPARSRRATRPKRPTAACASVPRSWDISYLPLKRNTEMPARFAPPRSDETRPQIRDPALRGRPSAGYRPNNVRKHKMPRPGTESRRYTGVRGIISVRTAIGVTDGERRMRGRSRHPRDNDPGPAATRPLPSDKWQVSGLKPSIVISLKMGVRCSLHADRRGTSQSAGATRRRS